MVRTMAQLAAALLALAVLVLGPAATRAANLLTPATGASITYRTSQNNSYPATRLIDSRTRWPTNAMLAVTSWSVSVTGASGAASFVVSTSTRVAFGPGTPWRFGPE